MVNRLPRASLLLVLSLSPACTSRLTGNEGNFEFSYIADDAIEDFNKPIAPGASLDIEVRTVGDRRNVRLDAVITDPSLFEVVEILGNRFTLRALREGNGLIEVEGQATGEPILGDSINLTAREPDRVRLSHTCVEGRNGLYLTGQRILVPFEMERSNGQPVIGYGRYPVVISDSTLLTLDASVRAQAFLHLDTGLEPGRAEILSDLDPSSLAVDIVAPDAITGSEIFFDQLIETDVGDTDRYFVLPTSGGQPICQAAIAKSVVSLTPETCTAFDSTPSSEGPELAWLAVTGVSAGTCELSVSYPTATMGGISTTVTIEIAP
ncbi:MAG: hypothetical protein AAFU79_07210 [Myxococcota bacterium]